MRNQRQSWSNGFGHMSKESSHQSCPVSRRNSPSDGSGKYFQSIQTIHPFKEGRQPKRHMDCPTNWGASTGLELHQKTLWKPLWSTEWIWWTAKHMRCALSKVVHHQSLSMVIAPGPNSTQHEYHQKAEMEKACLDKASRWFTQDKHTPLLTSLLIELFGEISHQKAITQVPDGLFQSPPNCDQYAVQFLSAVSCPPPPHMFPIFLSIHQTPI